jgi:hypothetical protein
MGSTTRKTQVAGQGSIPKIKPNTTAGAVIPLKKYLDKAAEAQAANLIPPSSPPLPANVVSTDVPISLWPLTSNGMSTFYAGRFDDQMHFSGSLLKVAALFAAGQFHAEAKVFAAGYTVWSKFLTDFNAALKTEINATAEHQILIYTPSTGMQLMPNTEVILKKAAFPTITFADGFEASLARMIVQSSESDSAVCIRALGYAYINTALKLANLFKSPTPGIWLGGTYGPDTYVRIACENDHPDAQVTASRKMCELLAMIRLGQVPPNDATVNGKMQGWLNEPKTMAGHTSPWIEGNGRGNTVVPLYTIVQDKIGVAGLGTSQTPSVYSEGLIIKWDDASQVDAFNSKIDPTNSHPEIHLSGEIAVCWQNLLDDLIPPPPGNFDGIINVINNSVLNFLKQTTPP